MVKDISEVVRASLSVHPFLQDYFVKLSDFEVFDDLKEHVALDEHILQEIACLGVISLGSENIDERFYLFLVKQLWVDITNSLQVFEAEFAIDELLVLACHLADNFMQVADMVCGCPSDQRTHRQRVDLSQSIHEVKYGALFQLAHVTFNTVEKLHNDLDFISRCALVILLNRLLETIKQMNPGVQILAVQINLHIIVQDFEDFSSRFGRFPRCIWILTDLVKQTQQRLNMLGLFLVEHKRV